MLYANIKIFKKGKQGLRFHRKLYICIRFCYCTGWSFGTKARQNIPQSYNVFINL